MIQKLLGIKEIEIVKNYLFSFSITISRIYKNSGKVKATATKKVSGMSNHHLLIFNLFDSKYKKTKKVSTTTNKSAP